MAGYVGRDAVIVGAVRTPIGKGKASGALHDVLPVDRPDEGHAIASTTANAASFAKKADDGRPPPVAFACIEVELRR